MTNSYDVAHGLSQDAPCPLQPVEIAQQPGDAPATGNTARDQEMYAAGIRTGEENAKHNAAIRAAAAPGASTAGNPQPARDWELTCHECDGSGHVYVKHQVAERKTDIQEFKEECECCEGSGFVFAFQDIPGIEEYVKTCRPAPAAPGASTVEDPSFPTGAIVNGRVLADRLEAYPFESQGGDLRLCSDWVEFRRCFEHLAEWVGSRAPAAGDALDAARWRFVRRKLCLTGNGDGTCAMQAINLPASIPGWPEPGSAVAEFCDAAIDAAIAAQRKGDA